jgi:hypothetical protein
MRGRGTGSRDRPEKAPHSVLSWHFYPWCTGSQPSNALILIGDADDWTPSSRCQAASNLTVHAGATHAFDPRRPD